MNLPDLLGKQEQQTFQGTEKDIFYFFLIFFLIFLYFQNVTLNSNNACWKSENRKLLRNNIILTFIKQWRHFITSRFQTLSQECLAKEY